MFITNTRSQIMQQPPHAASTECALRILSSAHIMNVDHLMRVLKREYVEYG